MFCQTYYCCCHEVMNYLLTFEIFPSWYCISVILCVKSSFKLCFLLMKTIHPFNKNRILLIKFKKIIATKKKNMQHILVIKNQDLIKIIVCNHDNTGGIPVHVYYSKLCRYCPQCSLLCCKHGWDLIFYFAQIDFFQIFLLSFTFNKMWSEEI